MVVVGVVDVVVVVSVVVAVVDVPVVVSVVVAVDVREDVGVVV